MFGAIHGRIIAFLHYAERCRPITVIIIKAGITFFATVCRLIMCTAFPAIIAHSGVVHVVVVTLSILALIFTVHINDC